MDCKEVKTHIFSIICSTENRVVRLFQRGWYIKFWTHILESCYNHYHLFTFLDWVGYDGNGSGYKERERLGQNTAWFRSCWALHLKVSFHCWGVWLATWGCLAFKTNMKGKRFSRPRIHEWVHDAREREIMRKWESRLCLWWVDQDGEFEWVGVLCSYKPLIIREKYRQPFTGFFFSILLKLFQNLLKSLINQTKLK